MKSQRNIQDFVYIMPWYRAYIWLHIKVKNSPLKLMDIKDIEGILSERFDSNEWIATVNKYLSQIFTIDTSMPIWTQHREPSHIQYWPRVWGCVINANNNNKNTITHILHRNSTVKIYLTTSLWISIKRNSIQIFSFYCEVLWVFFAWIYISGQHRLFGIYSNANYWLRGNITA